jgi:hypothetical protein
MLNGLWTNPWLSIQCPNFQRKFLPMNCYVVDFQFMAVTKLVVVLNYWIWKIKGIFNLDIHENKIAKLAL